MKTIVVLMRSSAIEEKIVSDARYRFKMQLTLAFQLSCPMDLFRVIVRGWR
jgi:hypothetical protein